VYYCLLKIAYCYAHPSSLLAIQYSRLWVPEYSIPVLMIAMSVLFSKAGAHFPTMAYAAGNVTPYIGGE